jgi:hypothetical protein
MAPRHGTPVGSAAQLAGAALAVLAALEPGAARGASISVEGGAIVLGNTQSSPVVIRVDEAPGTEQLPLRLSVNVGQFTEPIRLGPGKYRASYTPPATRFPQVALVALWRETGADARIDFLRIPLFGKTRVRLAARPRAEVRARVGIDAFGPVLADRGGRAEVPIHVEPGVQQCSVTIREASGAELTRQVPVEVPPYNRLTAALVPHAVVADGQSTVRLDVYYDLKGAQLDPERIRVTPSLGKATFERGARGVYTYRYVPPPDVPASNVTFQVSVAGDPAARATAQLALGLPPPAAVLVTGPSRRLRVGSGATGAVTALVVDAAGMGLPGLEVTATAAGRPLPAPTYRGGGAYELPLRAPDVYPPGGVVPVRVRARGTGRTVDGSLNLQLDAPPVPSSISARFVPAQLPADGSTEARLVLEVRDVAGGPLEHVQLVSLATHGVLGAAQERGNGLYEQVYRPPATLPDGDAAIRVTDASGSFERRFPIPLRPRGRRLLLGAGGGYTRSPGDASGARGFVDAWVPFGGDVARFGAGLSAAYGAATKTVSDPGGTLRSRTTATFVPLSVRLGWDAHAGRRLTVTVGGGAAAAFAEFRTSLSGEVAHGVGLGGFGFGDLAWALGPGQVVLGLSWGSVPVQTARYRLDPGGLAGTLGFRVGVL